MIRSVEQNMALPDSIGGLLNEPIDYIVLDFDKTFIRESLLVQWVLFLLLNPAVAPRKRLWWLNRSICRGIAAKLLSLSPKYCETAVKIAFGALSGVPVHEFNNFLLHPWKRRGRFGISLNDELLKVLQTILWTLRDKNFPQPHLIISSQGSFLLAMEKFLRREDVVRELVRTNICSAMATENAISFIANRLEIQNGKFNGRVIPPVITKYNRLQLFPGNALFIGDGRDESSIRRIQASGIRFLNCAKL